MWKNRKKEITISAAASLNEVLSQIVENYQKENKDVVINIKFWSFWNFEKTDRRRAPVDLYFLHLKRFRRLKKTESSIRKNSLEIFLKIQWW